MFSFTMRRSKKLASPLKTWKPERGAKESAGPCTPQIDYN